MASNRTKFSVGIFLILGVMLAVVAVMWVGMSGYLETGKNYAIYFNESVQGLDKDSAVKYRGVNVGKVERIDVAPDGNLIQVIVKIDTGKLPREQIFPEKDKGRARVDAQLKSVGITGIMFIELDQKKPGFQDTMPALTFSVPYPVIPSRPSEIRQLLGEVEKLFTRIQKLDFEGIAGSLKTDLDSIHQAIQDANVKAISERFTAALDKLNKILETERWDRILAGVEKAGGRVAEAATQARNTFESVEKILDENRGELKAAVAELRATVEESKKTAQKGGELITDTNARIGDLTKRLLNTAQNLEAASASLETLLENTAADPAEVIFGVPPRARKVQQGILPAPRPAQNGTGE